MSDLMRIVLGSVYLDRGEGLEYLHEQILRMAKQKPEYYFIDFICHVEQIQEAQELIANFYKMVGVHMPDIEMRNVLVAITCRDDIRPAATTLAALTSKDGFVIKDVNPDRKGRE